MNLDGEPDFETHPPKKTDSKKYAALSEKKFE
jgi:hypothetical protein